MRHRRSAVQLAAIALASALLGGCAEMHRGVEAVGRIGAAPAPDEAAPPEAAVRTVRPRGGQRAAEASPRVAVAAAVPAPREIFDFHPAGIGADGWRQPFIIDPSDGPLAADVRRSAAELRQFLADQKKGGAATASGGGVKTVRPRCGENEVARGEAGCGPALKRAAAAPAPQ